MADPISGGAGWVGAGLLGLVLAWLLLVHLPSKDRQIEKLFAQIKDMADKFTEERIADRESRHDSLNKFQDMVNKQQLDHHDMLKQQQMHCLEEMKIVRQAEDNRTASMNQAFSQRNQEMTNAIREALREQTGQFKSSIESVRETLLVDLRERKRSVHGQHDRPEEKEEQP